MRSFIGPGVRLYAVLKGDGYGCGAAEVAKVVLEAGADALAAGDPDDVIAIRRAGISGPILMYPSTLPESAAALVDLDVTLTIHDFASLDAVTRLSAPVRVFVKVDTGLNRLGFAPDDWRQAFALCAKAPQLQVVGLCTHFPAPADPNDSDHVRQSAERFQRAGRAAKDAGLDGFLMMAASSPFVAAFRDVHFSAVDPGRILYDLVDKKWHGALDIEPVFRAVKSKVIEVKEARAASQVGYRQIGQTMELLRLAVLPIGFTDGLPAFHSGEVLIEGRRARVLSELSMEHTVVDVTDIPAVHVGSEAVLLGHQGDDSITPAELARATGLTEFEMLIRLGSWLRRVYVT